MTHLGRRVKPDDTGQGAGADKPAIGTDQPKRRNTGPSLYGKPLVSTAHIDDLSSAHGFYSRKDSSGVEGRPFSPKAETRPKASFQESDHRPASILSIVDLVGKGWSHRVVNTTKTHAVVMFTSPDGSMREERTILRDMLPNPAPVKHHGRPVLHLGKTARDHETGSWKQHLDNKAAHAELNRGHAVDHGAGTKGGGRHGGKYDN